MHKVAAYSASYYIRPKYAIVLSCSVWYEPETVTDLTALLVW